MARPRTPRATPAPSDTLLDHATRAGLDPEALRGLRGWIAEQLVADEFAKLSQGGHAETQVPLRRVFVDLPMTIGMGDGAGAGEGGRRLHFLEILMRSGPEPLDGRRSRIPDDAELCEPTPEPRSRRTIGARLEESAGMVLIGGPGQGKSTLGQLACQLHRAALLAPKEATLTSAVREVLALFQAKPESPEGDALAMPARPLFPLRVVLPDAAAWLARSPPAGGLALLRFLADQPSGRKHQLDPAALERLLRVMPLLLVLDGLDEVGAVEDRDRVVAAGRELIAALGEHGASGLVVATTRPQGYAGELSNLGLPLTVCQLARLDEAGALAYAERLIAAKIPGVDDQKKALDALREAAREPATAHLMRTPLQVTILAGLAQRGAAPRERWRLFHRYFDFTWEREIERRSWASSLLKQRRGLIEAIHLRAALLLQVESESAGGGARLTRPRLEEIVGTVLQEEDGDLGEEARRDLIREIVDAAEKRLVFLVEPEPGAFGFEIRSLQEFLAAWALGEGREAMVEARFLQVARAPLFRNVALFMASRFFSERSPLRDVLAGRVCGEMDEDPTDELLRATCAGAMLALEALEEGAALEGARRAQALMERAARLLDLPPAAEHDRLARVATDETALVLIVAIEAKLLEAPPERTGAAWRCLLTAADRGLAPAVALAERLWVGLERPAEVLERVGMDWEAGRWVLARIEARPEAVLPTQLLWRRRDAAASIGGWVGSIGRLMEGDRSLHEAGEVYTPSLSGAPPMKRPIAQLRSPDRRVTMDPSAQRRPAAMPTGPVPRGWEGVRELVAWLDVPSAHSLAMLLRALVDQAPALRHMLASGAGWPLEACLSLASSSEELVSIAMLLERGELGDIGDWTRADASWRKTASLIEVIEAARDGMPWTLDGLGRAPPLTASWYFGRQLPGSPAGAVTEGLLRVSRAVRDLHHPAQRARLASYGLVLLAAAPAGTPVDAEDVESWIDLCEGVIHLIPRPPAIDLPTWRRLIERRAPGSSPTFYGNVFALVAALRDAPESTMLLQRARRTLHYTPSSYDASALSNPSEIFPLLRSPTWTTPASRADAAILRVALGDIPAHEVPSLLATLRAAPADPDLWFHLFQAIFLPRLPAPLVETLALAAFAELGPTHPGAADALARLRGLQRTRRTGLDVHGTWDGLDLPLPHPRAPLRPPSASEIPDTPIVLERLRLQHVRGLHDLELTLAAPAAGRGQWVVLLGPNGAGKTTILRSLALALRDLTNPSIWPKEAFSPAWHRLDGPGEARITLQIRGYGERVARVRANGSETFFQEPELGRPRLFPLFAYGCRRGSVLGGNARAVDLSDGTEIATLFDEGATLIHGETWLKEWDGDAQRNTESKAVFDAVTAALCQLLKVTSVKVEDQQVWITELNGRRLPFSAMSDGYLTTAGWFLDLLARWIHLARRHPIPIDAGFLKRMMGLVLLDEIDLHLFPRWQLDLIARTRSLLPNMSFVVTTHNPLTLVGAQPEEIWILEEKDGVVRASPGVDAPMLLTGGQIYRRYFGIDAFFPHALGQSLERYGFLVGFPGRTDEEEQEMERLGHELRAAGVDPGWEPVPRTSAPAPATRGRRKRGAEA